MGLDLQKLTKSLHGLTELKIGTQCVHVCYLKVIVGYDVFSCAL